MKFYGLNRWKNIIKDLEMHAVKMQLKRLSSDVETLKMQELVMRTTFKVQKSELESKVSELVAHVLGSTGGGTGSAL